MVALFQRAEDGEVQSLRAVFGEDDAFEAVSAEEGG